MHFAFLEVSCLAWLVGARLGCWGGSVFCAFGEGALL